MNIPVIFPISDLFRGHGGYLRTHNLNFCHFTDFRSRIVDCEAPRRIQALEEQGVQRDREIASPISPGDSCVWR
jgi:hypothetical protein